MGLLGGYCETTEELAAVEQRDREYMEAQRVADRIEKLESALHAINALNDSPARFNKEIQDVLDSVIDTSDHKF